MKTWVFYEDANQAAEGGLWDRLSIALLIVLLFGLLLEHIDRVRTPIGDAIYYQYYINYFLHHSIFDYPALFDIYFSQPQNVGFSAPIRLGYILPLALYARIFGYSFSILSFASLLAHLGTVFTAWFFCRRWIGALPALAVACLTGFSPLLLGLATSPLTDSYNLFFQVLSTFLFLELFRNSGNRLMTCLFMLVFTFFLVIRENNFLFGIPLAAYLFWQSLPRKKVSAIIHPALFFLPFFIALGAYIAVAGGISPMMKILTMMREVASANPYTMTTGSGPWYSYLIDYLVLSPFTFIFFFFFFGAALLGSRGFSSNGLVRFFILTVPLVLLLYAPLPKCVRYLAIIDIAIRLFSALFIHEALVIIPAKKRIIAFCVAVLVCCILDFALYKDLFIRHRIYDPVTHHLLYYRKVLSFFN